MTTNGSRGDYTSMVKSKFLDKPDEIGVVAVGFSGGQVGTLLS